MTRDERQAEVLRMVRESGLERRDFADLVGVTVNTLNRWCTGVRLPQEYAVRLMRYKLINQGYLRR